MQIYVYIVDKLSWFLWILSWFFNFSTALSTLNNIVQPIFQQNVYNLLKTRLILRSFFYKTAVFLRKSSLSAIICSSENSGIFPVFRRSSSSGKSSFHRKNIVLINTFNMLFHNGYKKVRKRAIQSLLYRDFEV